MNLHYESEVVIDSQNVAVKDGRMYRMFYTASIAAGASIDILSIYSTTKTTIFHNRIFSNTGSYFTVSAYAEPTLSNNGTLITGVFNLNVASSNTSTTAHYLSPTISDLGLLVDREFLAGGTGAGSKTSFGAGASTGVSSILLKGGKILTRITNSGVDTGLISIALYYEEIDN